MPDLTTESARAPARWPRASPRLAAPVHHVALRIGCTMLLALCAACAGVQSALDPAADQALAIHAIWRLMLWICGFMYLLVLVALAAAIWRGRREGGAAAPGAGRLQRVLPLMLAVWVGAIALGLIVLTASSFLVDRHLAPGPDSALTVRVTGQQWWWQIEYPGRESSGYFNTANELHLPLGERARIELGSADVIHSFWVPNLSGKRDMIPGRDNAIELTPRRIGVFRGQCAEYCGRQHARMALTVVVEDAAAFAAWRARQLQPAAAPASAMLIEGARVFADSGCALCHSIRGTAAGAQAGPDLTHLAARRTLAAGTLPMNPGALAAWIADPQSQKPGTRMPAIDLEPDQLTALVAYLLSLG